MATMKTVLFAVFLIALQLSNNVIKGSPLGDVREEIDERIEEERRQYWIDTHKGLVIGLSVAFLVAIILLCTCCCCCGCCCFRRNQPVIVHSGGQAAGGTVVVTQQQQSMMSNPSHAGYNQ